MSCFLLHGFMGSREDWAEICACLQAAGLHCVPVDLPGHGASAPIEPNYLKLLQEEIEGRMKRSEWGDRCILVGYSMGGRVALQLADAFPSFYTHLILLSAHPGLVDPAQREARWLHDLSWIEKWDKGVEAFLEEWYNQPLFQSLHRRPALLQRILARRSFQDPQKMKEVMRALSLAHQKPFLSFPPRTLFLHGQEDVKYKKIYDELKGVCVQEVEESGHVIHLENPQRCAELILQWLEKV